VLYGLLALLFFLLFFFFVFSRMTYPTSGMAYSLSGLNEGPFKFKFTMSLLTTTLFSLMIHLFFFFKALITLPVLAI
jgi:predicted secreted protein